MAASGPPAPAGRSQLAKLTWITVVSDCAPYNREPLDEFVHPSPPGYLRVRRGTRQAGGRGGGSGYMIVPNNISGY